MDKDIKKRVINRTVTDTPQGERLHTYDRVMREAIAARAARRSVDYVRKIYHCIDQEEIDKLFDDLFYRITSLLEKLEG